jgi:hypothetical protein
VYMAFDLEIRSGEKSKELDIRRAVKSRSSDCHDRVRSACERIIIDGQALGCVLISTTASSSAVAIMRDIHSAKR